MNVPLPDGALGIAVAAAVVLAAMAAGIKALPTVWRALVAVGQVPKHIELIASEFSPNGGGSIRDSIDRVEGHVAVIADWMDAHEERDDAFEERMRKFEEYSHKRNHDIINLLFMAELFAALPADRQQEFLDSRDMGELWEKSQAEKKNLMREENP